MSKADVPFDAYLKEQLRDPELRALFDEASERMEIALQIIKLREAHGLTQAQLAERVGTSQQTISRLENPGYQGHSLRTLRRIADALDARIEVRVVPNASPAAKGSG